MNTDELPLDGLHPGHQCGEHLIGFWVSQSRMEPKRRGTDDVLDTALSQVVLGDRP